MMMKQGSKNSLAGKQPILLLKAILMSATFSVCSLNAVANDNAEAVKPAADLKVQKAALGSAIFHDTSLSNPPGQSCATCHDPAKAFADPGKDTSPGALEGKVGNRNAPSLMYLKYVMPFGKEEWSTEWRGGFFWDGRANTLQEQARGPILNPLEMNNTVEGAAKALKAAGYAPLIKSLYGDLNDDEAWVDAATDALAEFQLTDTFAPFTSKFDYSEAGLVKLTKQEERGHQIFNAKGMCIDCHSGRFDAHNIFTQFKFHNILVPKNPGLGFYDLPKDSNPDGRKYIDPGLANNPHLTGEDKKQAFGQFRSPSLRNVAITAPYMHNGVFKTLREVIQFYNKMENFWPAETFENQSRMINTQLNLTPEEIQALVAFLKTLTDGYEVTPEIAQKLKEHHAAQAKLIEEQGHL